MFASVGPVSSLHDRACELYYAIKGGVVDYGEAHSSANNHKRFGRDRGAGLYPQWSTTHPIHMLGHSIGGSTIIKLQHMLATGFFPDAHPDMILSISSISSPFRGTQLSYILGERLTSAPSVRPLSLGSLFTKVVHVLSYVSPFLPTWLDFHTESRSMSLYETSVLELCGQLWKSDWAESRDATPFDVTFGAAEEREGEGEGRVWGGTWYRSWAAVCTKKSDDGFAHAPILATLLLPPMYICSKLLASFDYTAVKPTPSFIFANETTPRHTSPNEVIITDESTTTVPPSTIPPNIIPHNTTIPISRSQPEKEDPERAALIPRVLGEEYHANDGVVPLFSQWHPLACSATRCTHEETTLGEKSTADDRGGVPEPGRWHVVTLNDAHHLSLVPLWLKSRRQREFWVEVGGWLRSVEAAAAASERDNAGR